MDDLPVPGGPMNAAVDTVMKIVSWNITGEEYGFWDLAVTLSQLFG